MADPLDLEALARETAAQINGLAQEDVYQSAYEHVLSAIERAVQSVAGTPDVSCTDCGAVLRRSVCWECAKQVRERAEQEAEEAKEAYHQKLGDALGHNMRADLALDEAYRLLDDAAVVLKGLRKYVLSMSAAEHMLDGFGPRSHQQSDDDLEALDEVIAEYSALVERLDAEDGILADASKGDSPCPGVVDRYGHEAEIVHCQSCKGDSPGPETEKA